MRHIFETTLRSMVKDYSAICIGAKLTQVDGRITLVERGVDSGSIDIRSNEDSFVMSLYTTNPTIADTVVYFVDGTFAIFQPDTPGLRPHTIGTNWSASGILDAIETIFKVVDYTHLVFESILKLSKEVATTVSWVIKGIVNQLDGHQIECSVMFATPGSADPHAHLLRIGSGDGQKTFPLEFRIDRYIGMCPLTLLYPLNQDVKIVRTGKIYTDIREGLVLAIMESGIPLIGSCGERSSDISLAEIIEILVPRCKSEEVSEEDNDTLTLPEEAKPSVNRQGAEYDIVVELANLVSLSNRYDIATYLNHRYTHELVLLTKTHVDGSSDMAELPLFRVTIHDGIVVVKFDFHNPRCTVTVYMLPGYDGQRLDKVTIILENDTMYKRGVYTIGNGGIPYTANGILNGSLVAMRGALGSQYGTYSDLLDNLDPIFEDITSDLNLNSKVLYPVT